MNLQQLWTSFKESLPFVTRHYHIAEKFRITQAHAYNIIELEKSYQIRLNAAIERGKQEERASLDPYLKILSAYATYQPKSPPYEWRFQLTIDPEIAMTLRDPGLNLDTARREAMINALAGRLHYYIANQLMYGLRNMQEWERFK